MPTIEELRSWAKDVETGSLTRDEAMQRFVSSVIGQRSPALSSPRTASAVAELLSSHVPSVWRFSQLLHKLAE